MCVCVCVHARAYGGMWAYVFLYVCVCLCMRARICEYVHAFVCVTAAYSEIMDGSIAIRLHCLLL